MATPLRMPMNIASYEALQRASLQWGAQYGVHQPSMIESDIIPDNLNELQRPFRDAVLSGKSGLPTFVDRSAINGQAVKSAQVSFLQRLFGGRR
jgi:hypothetical protein